MSRKTAHRSLERTKANKAARRAAIARGALPTERAPRPPAQMDHASNGRARKKRRDMGGE